MENQENYIVTAPAIKKMTEPPTNTISALIEFCLTKPHGST